MEDNIENFIYKHSAPNGCVALTRTERDELFEMVEQMGKENAELKMVISKMETIIEKMKSDFRNLDTSGTKEFVLERIWNLFEEWEFSE